MKIRDANPTDIPDILVVEKTGHLFPWSEQVFNDCFKDTYFILLLVDEDIASKRTVMGFSIVSNIVGEAHLLNICIHSDCYRNGYGSQLLNATIKRAISESCESVLLEVRESNRSAIAMYEKFGFTMIGKRKGYYPSEDGREDALVYQLSLSSDSIDQHA